MRFLNFFRRVNRGIIMAIVLVIGLSCYLTVDGIAFKKERETVKQVVENYIKDMQSFLLLPEQYREIDVNVPDAVIENKIKENNALVGKYFANTSHRGWNMKESIAGDLEHMLRNNKASGNIVKSYDAKLVKVSKISKYGSNLVTVEASIETTTTATESAELFCVFHGGFGHFDKAYSDNPVKTFSTQSYEVSFTCDMVKQGDTWLFSNSEGMFWGPKGRNG